MTETTEAEARKKLIINAFVESCKQTARLLQRPWIDTEQFREYI
jgi:hypothetical protein